jgi:predicted NBD/HSP70 family sugar kinase
MVSASLAGELNRARVLKTLYANGPLPRPELARLTGSTRATIGQIVQPLLEAGLLEEQQPLASGAQGGKPARPVWFSDDGWLVGAVVFLPDRAQAALVTAGGRIVATATIRFRSQPGNHDLIVGHLTRCLHEVISHAASPVRGIGVAVGGMVDTLTGDIVRVDLAPGLNGLPVGPMIAASTGIPTFVDLQPRAQALGDLLFGVGRGQESFCSIYIGEGIGAGFILDGALHRGARGAGGEVGHAVIDASGPVCTCGLNGCWEVLAATRWLRATSALRGLPRPGSMTVTRLSSLARKDPAAADVLAAYAVNVATGIANIQQTLGLGLFVLHGDPVGGAEPLRAAIEEQVRQRAFAHPGGLPRVAFAERDDYATVRGAAGIVLSRSLHIPF